MNKPSNHSGNNKGYTLLFAVITASILLAIAAFIASVSRKQFLLASTARDSMTAIYAADAGLDWGVEQLDKIQPPSSETYLASYNENFNTPQSNGSSCAIVSISIIPTNSSLGTGTTTTIISRGYNIGWNSGSCSTPSSRRVERALELDYSAQ